MILQIEHVHFSYGSHQVLQDITFAVEKGEFVGIAGLNGSGKTTLLKLCSRIYRPASGRIFLKGKDLNLHLLHELAKHVASVTQRISLSFEFTVRQFVMLGRTPYLGFFKQPSAADEQVVDEVLRKTDSRQFADRSVLSLSAGELQRVCIAGALAQEPQVLLLDEPTDALDIRQRSRLSRLLLDLQKTGITTLCASHDLEFLRRHAMNALVLHQGRLGAFGPAEDVLSQNNLVRLFEMEEELHSL